MGPRQLTDKRQAAAYNAIFTGRPPPGHVTSLSYPYYAAQPPPRLSVPIHPSNGRLGLDFADPATSSDDGSSELPWVNTGEPFLSVSTRSNPPQAKFPAHSIPR